MELDLQSLFRLRVHSFTHWLRPCKSPPPALGSYTRALLVSQEQDRRHLYKCDPPGRGIGECTLCTIQLIVGLHTPATP
jgi:hypothetical protein